MLDDLNMGLDTGDFFYNPIPFISKRDMSSESYDYKLVEPSQSIRVINRTAMTLNVIDMAGISSIEPAMHSRYVSHNSHDIDTDTVSVLVTYSYPTVHSFKLSLLHLNDKLDNQGGLNRIESLMLKEGNAYINRNLNSLPVGIVNITLERKITINDFFTETINISKMTSICSTSRSKALIISDYGIMLYLGVYDVTLKVPDYHLNSNLFVTEEFREAGVIVKILVVDNADIVEPQYIKLGKDTVEIPIIKSTNLKDGIHYVSKVGGKIKYEHMTLEKAKSLMFIDSNRTLVEKNSSLDGLKERLALEKLLKQEEIDMNKRKRDDELYIIEKEQAAVKLEEDRVKFDRSIHKLNLEMEQLRMRLKSEKEQAEIRLKEERAKHKHNEERATVSNARHKSESYLSILKTVVATAGTCAGAYTIYSKMKQ